MFEALKDFDFLKVLFWIVPGTFMVLFRSFAIRGSFPPLKKDDVATLILGSVVFAFLLNLFGIDLSAKDIWTHFSPFVWIIMLVLIPAVVGFAIGFLEASDVVGRGLRHIGVRLPSPDATAWETMFRELSPNAVLLITLKDGATVFGRWIGGRRGSASSADTAIRDIFLGEIGTIDRRGRYVPKSPRRGIYISSEEIRWIEVVNPG